MKKKTEKIKKTKSAKKAPLKKGIVKSTRKSDASKKSTKKSTKKTSAPRKTVKKKPVHKKVARKRKVKIPLVYAEDWQVFHAVNGAALRSLEDFYKELETMREDEYLYHKNTGDHFATWVREVLGDDACARDLLSATSIKKARTVLKKHLSRYKL
jgi:hypothetical protein